MVRTGTLLDSGMVYFDARLSQHYPTLEVRIADVCLRHEDAVLIAALVRGLVETEALGLAARRRAAADAHRTAPARGLAGQPVGPGRPAHRPVHRAAGPGTAAVTGLLLDHVRDALADAGDLAAVTGLVAEVQRRGNGASFQRDAFGRSGLCCVTW